MKFEKIGFETSTVSSQYGGAAALLGAPPRHLNSSAHLYEILKNLRHYKVLNFWLVSVITAGKMLLANYLKM